MIESDYYNHDCASPQECWVNYWVPVWKDAGDPIPSYNEVVANELNDYHFILSGLGVFYDVITGGRISKPNTMKFEVVREVEQRISDAWDEGYDEGRDEGYDVGYDAGFDAATA